MDDLIQSRPVLRELFEYWASRKMGRRFPMRSDLDPVDIPALLRHLLLIDVEREGQLRFRVRLIGTHVESVLRMTVTGQYVDEFTPTSQTRRLLSAYMDCAENGRPFVSHEAFRNDKGTPFSYVRLLLPLAVRVEHRVDMILGSISFDSDLVPSTSAEMVSDEEMI